MAEKEQAAKLAELRQALDQSSREFPAARREVRQQLSEAAAQVDLTWYDARVVAAGRDSSGDYLVSFNTPDAGYGAYWPAWAGELAKEALLNNRMMWLYADGGPWGANLMAVYITDNAPDF